MGFWERFKAWWIGPLGPDTLRTTWNERGEPVRYWVRLPQGTEAQRRQSQVWLRRVGWTHGETSWIRSA